MAEEKRKKIIAQGHPEGCMCMGCRTTRLGCVCGCGKHSLYHSILRCLLLLIIFGVVFCLGVRVGSFHGMYAGHYDRMHYGMPGGHGDYSDTFYYGPGKATIKTYLPAATSSTSSPAYSSTTVREAIPEQM